MKLLGKKISKVLFYEVALFTLALAVVLFDFVCILGNPSPIMSHRHQQASVNPIESHAITFSESCEGMDKNSSELKSMVQRGFCSLFGSK